MDVRTQAGKEIAAVLIRHGLSYEDSKTAIALARRTARLKRPRDKQTVIERLTQAEASAFLDAAWKRSGRDGLMLRTLLETATRNAELVALDVRHVDAAERVVEIHDGKGGKNRVVPITPTLAQLLTLHVGKRQAGPLFISRQRGSGVPYQLSTRRVRQVVKQTADAAGITKKVYPHLLRHTTATRLLLDGMKLHDVALFLGHSSTQTTERYAVASTVRVRKAFDQVSRDPDTLALVERIERERGPRAAVFAADLLARATPASFL